MKTKFSIILLLLVSFGLLAEFDIIPLKLNLLQAGKETSYKDIKAYKTLWEKTDSLIEIGQPKSALKVVEVIYAKAKRENNSPQFLKAVMVTMSVKSTYEENYLVKSIAYLQKEIHSTSGSRKAILQSALAEQYYRYYSDNRWKIQERSETANFDKKDIETWTTTDIFTATMKYYNASLSNPEILQKISLKNYTPILTKQHLSTKYRPTLYDFLAHQRPMIGCLHFCKNVGIIYP